MVADRPNLRRRRRVVGEEVVGEGPGPDLERLDGPHPFGDAAHHDLGGAAADVDDRHVPLDRVAQGLGGADERQTTLLVLAQHLDLHPRHAGDLGHDLGAVGRLANRRRGHGTYRLGSHLLGEPDLGGDRLGELGDLVGVDRPVVLRGLADPRVGALLHHLAKLALLRLGDQHAGGVRTDVDRRAQHAGAILSDGTDAAVPGAAPGNGPFTRGSLPLHGGPPAAVETRFGCMWIGLRSASA